MIRYEMFYKRFLTRRKSDINRIHVEQDDMELPTGSILHTADGFKRPINKESIVTPDLNNYSSYLQDKRTTTYFNLNMPDEGSVIPYEAVGITPYLSTVPKDLKKFRAEDRSTRFIIRSLEDFQNGAKFQNIISHDPLFRVKLTGIMREVRMFNMMLTAMVNKVAELPDREHFLVFDTENLQFSKTDFVRSLKGYTKMSIRYPESYYYQLIMHIYGMLAEQNTDSIFEKVPEHVLSKINIVLRNGSKFVIYRLDVLKAMVTATPNIAVELLHQVNQLSLPAILADVETVDSSLITITSKPGAVNGTIFKETPSLDELTKQAEESIKDHDITVTKAILADTTTTPAQKKHISKLATSYKDIVMSDGVSLTSVMIGDKEVSLESNTITSVMKGLPDQSMATSSMINFNTEYMDKSFKKDMVSQLVSLGESGMYLTALKEEDISDSLSDVIRYTATFKDKDGVSHPIKFRLPKVDSDGICKINGTSKRMELQRINTPICKVAPDTVSLSSSYNKTRIQRNASFSNNFLKYVQRIIKKSDGKVKEVVGGYKYGKITLPYEYTTLGKHYNKLITKNISWSFDYENRFVDAPQEAKSLESKYGVYFGTVNGALTFINIQGVLTTVAKDKTIISSTILNTLNTELPDVKFTPFNEWVNFNVLNAKLPVIFVLAYQFGLSDTLAYLDVKFTTHGVKEHISTNPSDIVVRFNDMKIVVKDPTPVIRLLVSGLNTFDYRDIAFKEMDAKDTYYDLMQSKKLSINYLRGIDDLFALFMDPITKDVLLQMGEPTNVRDLLIRATVLLSTEDSVEPASSENFRYRSYERFNAITYKLMSRELAKHNNKSIGNKNKFSISEYEIMGAVVTDPLFKNVDLLNPIGDLKAIYRYSHLGDGGRTEDSMVTKDRRMPDDGIGIISEASTDSSSIGISGIISTDPNVKNIRGMCTVPKIDDVKPANVFSSTALLTPFSDKDDVKRQNFISEQMPHYLPIKSPSKARVRTGYERVVAQRSRLPFAYAALEDGEVIDVDEKLKTIRILYKSSGYLVLEYGSSISKNGGGGFHVKQNVVLNKKIKAGHRFKKEDILVYNSDFFSNDPYSDGIDLNMGVFCNVALIEGSGVMDDSSIITKSLSKKLESNPVRERTISISRNTTIHSSAMIGTSVKSIDPIMVFDETPMDDSESMDADTLAAIASLNRSTPKAKYSGTILKMKAFYTCDPKDMSKSVKTLVRAINKEGLAKSKYAEGMDNSDKFLTPSPLTGDKLDGKILGEDDIVIKFYIEQDLGCGTGDKIVFSASLKSVISNVQEQDIVTADGSITDIVALAQCGSIQNRIVLGTIQGAVTERVIKGIEDKFLDTYFS